MKKRLSLLLAAMLVAGVAAPAFAETTLINCVFKDTSLCEVRTLSDIKDDD